MTTLTNEPTMKIRALERTDLKNIQQKSSTKLIFNIDW